MIPAAGARASLLTFQHPTMSGDAHGGAVVTAWESIATAWCGLKTLSARERMAAMRLQVLATHEITAPWCVELTTLTTSDRIDMSGRIFNIVSVINTDEANEEIVMLVEEGVPT